VNVEEWFSADGRNFEFDCAQAPYKLCIPNINLLAKLDFLAWYIDSVLLLPSTVELLPILPPLKLVYFSFTSITFLS
jgi:hypothetical protein